MRFRRLNRWMSCLLCAGSCTVFAEPGFLPFRADPETVPRSELPVTNEGIHRETLRRGWGVFQEPYTRAVIRGQGDLLLVEEPVGVEMPHANWGKPWAGGSLRVLGLMNAWRARTLVELSHRLDGRVFSSFSVNERFRDGDAAVATAMHLDRLQRHDPETVLLADSENLPEAVLEELRRRVEHEGMGLVVLATHRLGPKEPVERPVAEWAVPHILDLKTGWSEVSADWAPAGAPHPAWWGVPGSGFADIATPAIEWLPDGWEPLASLGDRTWIAAGTIGRGRVAVITVPHYGLLSMFRDDTWRQSRENRQVDAIIGLLQKVLLWSAGKEAPVLLDLDAPGTVVWDQAFETVVGVLQGDHPNPAVVHLRLQDDDGRDVWTDSANLTVVPDGRVAFRVPPPPRAGDYQVTAVLRDAAGRTLNWHSRVLRVAGGPDVNVELEQEIWRPDELFQATLYGAEEASRLVVELWDRFGRIVARAEGAAPGPVSLATPLSGLNGPAFMLVARAWEGEREIARVEREVSVPTFGLEEDFRKIAWIPSWPGRIGLHLGMIRHLGFDTMTTGPWGPRVIPAQAAAWNGLGLFLENANHLSTCLSDRYFPGKAVFEKHFEAVIPAMAEQVLARYGCRLLSMSNEAWSYKGVPVDQRVITDNQVSRFRDYLRRVYGDIAALNTQWETAFSDFGEVVPPAYTERPDSMNFSRFTDWELFFLDTSVAQQVRSRDLYFRLMGGECPWGSTSGANTEQQFAAGATLHGNSMGDGRHFTHNTHNPAWFSLTGGGTSFSWVGYSYDEWAYDFYIWHNLLHGSQTHAIFTTGNVFTQAGTYTARAEWTRRYQQPIHDGIGKLLATSVRHTDPVAILHSDLSQMIIDAFARQQSEDRHAGQFYRRFAAAGARSVMQLIVDAQLHPTYVTDAQIADGGLSDMKMLIIPAVVAMTPAAADAIRTFAEAGGVVVADLTPAIFDGHGKLLPAGLLDDFFGFHRASLRLNAYPAEYTLGITADTVSPWRLPREWLYVEIREDDIRLTDGHALGGHIVGSEPPAFIFKRHGEGASLYLNYLDTQYKDNRNERHLRVMRALLEWADVRPMISVTDGHDRIEQFDVTWFTDDRTLHAGLNRDQRENRRGDDVVVTFPRAGHAYDVRDGRYLGFGQAVEANVPQWRQKLISLLPCRIDAVSVVAPTTWMAGETIEVFLSAHIEGEPTSLVYRMELLDADGRVMPAYTRIVRTPPGRTEWRGELRTAFNEPEGAYTLRAVEIVSGMFDEKIVYIRRP